MSDLTQLLKDQYFRAKEDISRLSTEDLLILAAACLSGARLADEYIEPEELVATAKREFEQS